MVDCSTVRAARRPSWCTILTFLDMDISTSPDLYRLPDRMGSGSDIDTLAMEVAEVLLQNMSAGGLSGTSAFWPGVDEFSANQLARNKVASTTSHTEANDTPPPHYQ